MPTDGITEITSDEILISNGADVLGLLYGNENSNLILDKRNITPAFFDLSTGIAGDVVQKLVNYRCRIAVVGDFSDIDSKSFRDFVYESNQRGNIFFLASIEEARERLLRT